ncbi:hypothetical protein ABK040_005122 [Willaertia magna]
MLPKNSVNKKPHNNNENVVTEGKQSSSSTSPTQLNNSKLLKTNKKPMKMIIVKYFEDTDKYAKIIPRPALHVLKRRAEEQSQLNNNIEIKAPTKEDAENMTIVYGKDLIGLMVRDQADWFSLFNPIVSVLAYNDKENKFIKVTDEMEFDASQQENVYTFHTKRKVAVEHCVAQSTMTFSSIGGAETWLESAFTKVNRNVIIRYHDIFHNGYTRIYKNEKIPSGRTGKSMVKLLIENILPSAIENQEKLLEMKQDVIHEMEGFIEEEDEGIETPPIDWEQINEKGTFVDLQKDESFYLVGKDDFEESNEEDEFIMVEQGDSLNIEMLHLSRFADKSKVPVTLLISEDYRQRGGAWKEVTSFPLNHAEVSKKTKRLIRNGIPQSKRCLLWMGITGSTTLLKQSPHFYENHFEKTYGHYEPMDGGVVNGGKTQINRRLFIESVDPRIVAEFGGKLPGVNSSVETPVCTPVVGDNNNEQQKNGIGGSVEEEKTLMTTTTINISGDDICYLTSEGIKAAKRILCVLADHHLDIDFCPPIPDLVHFLLILMNEKQAYATIHCILEKSRESKWYFRTNKMQHALFVESFTDIINKNIPNLGSHFEKVGFDLSGVAYKWFSRLFVPYLPFNFVMRSLDAFINEGAKILYRVGYAILKTLEPKLLKILSPNYMEDVLLSTSTLYVDEEEFFKTAFKFGLSRKHLNQLDEKNRTEINPQKLTGKISQFVKPKIGSTSDIINSMSQWELLVSWLPYKQRVRTLTQRFTTSRDGYSLSQLYNICNDIGPNIILISAVPFSLDGDIEDIKRLKEKEDSSHQVESISESEEDAMKVIEMIRKHKEEGKSLRKELKKQVKPIQTTSASFSGSTGVEKKKKSPDVCIFGAYCGDSYDKTYRYEGTTDTFLFSMYPIEAKYKWSRKNDFFVMGRKDRLVFGAGGDGPALQIDDNLRIGSSERCLTFDNEPLCGTKTTFSILKVEVWNFK